jgi:hypothetical protein
MSLIIPANSLAGGGYQVDNSLRFNSGSSDYLVLADGTPTDALKWTYSTWVKRSTLGASGALLGGYQDGNNWTDFYFSGGNALELTAYISSSVDITVNTNALFRDVSAWYHIVLVYDSANGTASNRVKIYVNGVLQTINTATYPSLNYATKINASGVNQNISFSAQAGFNGYIAETYFIDGQALTPTDFGEFDEDSGIWKPIVYEGTYGTNGFFLEFTNSTPLTQDASWTDTLSAFTTTNGDVIGSTTAAAIKSTATFTGDFEWTFTVDYAFNGGSDNYFMGLYEISEDGTFNSATGAGGGMSSMTDSWYMTTGGAATKFYYGGSLQSSTGVLTAGDEIRMSRTSGTITIYKNNTSLYQFTPTSTNEIRFVVSNLGSSYIIDLSDSRWRSPTTEPNLGTDYSGNENNFTVNNLTSIDQTTDTPTNNFCTWNAISAKFSTKLFQKEI